jgi:hypothetical protein
LPDTSIATPACFCELFAWMTFFYPFTLSQFFFFFVSEMHFLEAINGQVLQFNAIYDTMSFDWGIEAIIIQC